MAVRTAVLARGAAAGIGNNLLATVPAGQIWIVKGVYIFNPINASITCQTRIYDPTNTFYLPIGAGVVLGLNNESVQNNTFFVLDAGCTVQLNVTAAGPIMWMNGAALVLP